MNKGISNIVGVIIVAVILMIGIGGYMYLKNKQVEQKINPTVQIISSLYSGWTGGGAQLTINNDGSVIYEMQPGRTSVDETKITKTIQLSNKELQEIKALVIDSNVFNYEDNYDCKSDCPTDGPSEGIIFIIDGKEKIISLSIRRNTPESLEQIIKRIDSIIQEDCL